MAERSDKLTLDSMDSTSDTLTLARLDRESQAPWECEYSYGGEADLHRHYDKCKKNPGHKNFIPVDKFSIDNLPEDYRHKELVDYIRAVSDLTVRVTVKYVSDKRPATVSGSRKPYPGYNNRGRRGVTVGTGRVVDVNMDDDRLRDNCKCKECKKSSILKKDFAIISIMTAAHVVFDDTEVEHTTCHLFFDRRGAPDSCSGVVTLGDLSPGRSDVPTDLYNLEHYTHDLDLARRLQQRIELMNEPKRSNIFTNNPQPCKFKPTREVQDRQPLLFLVSHPHGCSKQVSIGRLTGLEMFSNRIVALLYNTATCPGSSGAHVFVLPDVTVPYVEGKEYLDTDGLPVPRVHSGASEVQREVNFCNINEDMQAPKLVTLDMLQLNQGPWEDNFYSVEEEDQNQHYAACQKNPGHENFFPVDKFSMDHLPPSYRTDDVMTFIKLMSDLTVRVTVKYVSEKRPKTVPGTDIPYPWSSDRGSRLTRVGTGWIDYADISNDLHCPCKQCRNSPKPRPTLACIEIRTAAHLVYDELEAAHTTCHLFFESGETPAACRKVVTLTDMHSFHCELVDSTCVITYFIHDLDLVRSLQDMGSRYHDALHAIDRNGDFRAWKYFGGNTKQEPPLHIVVSHPHGCAKQVSIGCCGNPGNADSQESRCSHASIICPGSSGAPVIELSWQLVYPVIA